jgi:hypothetical protein
MYVGYARAPNGYPRAVSSVSSSERPRRISILDQGVEIPSRTLPTTLALLLSSCQELFVTMPSPVASVILPACLLPALYLAFRYLVETSRIWPLPLPNTRFCTYHAIPIKLLVSE